MFALLFAVAACLETDSADVESADVETADALSVDDESADAPIAEVVAALEEQSDDSEKPADTPADEVAAAPEAPSDDSEKPAEAAEATDDADEGPAYVHEDIPAVPYVHEDIPAEPYVHIEPLSAPVVMMDPWFLGRQQWGGLTVGHHRLMPVSNLAMPAPAVVSAPTMMSHFPFRLF